ncbi:MAG: glycyl-radical enzyme activating protein [Promethearchaeota archaeon]
METLIADIKRNALDDGPGIRTLIFFKGCPLDCVWCQNPETKSPKQEIKFERDYCSFCKRCIDACDQGALSLENEFRIKRVLCNFCGNCIKACPNQAYGFVGKAWTHENLLEIILKDKVFFDNTGGGVTFSGGEPTLHVEYLHGLLIKLKAHDIHICLETCGYFNFDAFKKKILPFLDLIYFDLKIKDSKLHEKYCGVSNELIFNNFTYLNKLNKIEILPRIPLIPGITTTRENLSNLVSFLKAENVKKVGLLPYNPLWLSKPSKIGVIPAYTRSESLSAEEKSQIKEIFSDFEFNDF